MSAIDNLNKHIAELVAVTLVVHSLRPLSATPQEELMKLAKYVAENAKEINAALKYFGHSTVMGADEESE